MMTPLTLALDWTPNINHIGFFVAQEKGFYQDAGLDLKIMDPSQDNYAVTPAKKVELGQADFALCPMESIISYRTKTTPFDLTAIAAILQADLSAIVVAADKGIHSPKELDGKTYASYKARYEDEIVRQMIRNDGGEGAIKLAYPEKLGIWDRIIHGSFDSTWIFMNWEALQPVALGASLRYFKMADYGVPYAYSPVIAASEGRIAEDSATYRAFLKATKAGYLFAQANPEETVSILQVLVPDYDRGIDLHQALEITAPHFGDTKTWGQMKEEVVQAFVDWLEERGLEKHRIPVELLMKSVVLL